MSGSVPLNYDAADRLVKDFLMSTNSQTVKEQAQALIEQLPDETTWDELAYQIELRASVERGLADANAGRLISVEEVMKEFGVTE